MNMIIGIKDQINSIYAKLKNSPLEEVELYPPIPNDRIIKFEEMFCVKLPLDYRSLLLLSNGFYYDGHEILGISLNSQDTRYDLTAAYKFEHYETTNIMFSHIVPFYPDGFGNFACFDTRKMDVNGICPIVFWEHDIEYDENNEPKIISTSFIEFILDEILFEQEP